MQLMNLSDNVSVAGQLEPAEVAGISEMGFDVLINNRPDFEVNDQPLSSDIADAAGRCGLRYYYYPVTSLDFPGSSYQAMKTLFGDSQAKTLAFCRSGTRSANLWLASLEDDIALAAAQEVSRLGIDPSMFLNMLKQGSRIW